MKRWQILLIALAGVAAVAAIFFLFIGGSGGETVATVNGVDIPKADVDEQIDLISEQQPGIFDGEKGTDLEKSYRDRFEEQLITNELIRQDALERGIKVSEKDVDEKFAQVSKLFNDDKKKLEDALKQQGMTPESYKERIREQLLLEKTVNEEVEDVSASDEEAQEEYDKNKESYEEPEQVRVSDIVIKDEEEAKKVLASIKGGADFSQQAKDKSEDPATKDNGGDLGFRQIKDFPPALGEAIGALSVGETSELVNDASGFHIMRLEDKKEARQRSFEESKEEIIQRLKLEKQRSKYLAYIEALKKKFKVVDNK